MMIFPTHTVMLAGRSESASTKAKKAAEKISKLQKPEASLPSIGVISVVYANVAYLGITRNGPIIRYRRQVNTYP